VLLICMIAIAGIAHALFVANAHFPALGAAPDRAFHPGLIVLLAAAVVDIQGVDESGLSGLWRCPSAADAVDWWAMWAGRNAGFPSGLSTCNHRS
jgi:hypothetical protein